MELKKANAVVLVLLLFVSCQEQPTVSTTQGSAAIECDESLYPIMQLQADDFCKTYTETNITLHAKEAREAVVNFVNDSIRVIVLARRFNKEELDVLKSAGIEYQAFKVALDGVAVIVNSQNRDTTIRITALDSIYNGTSTRWATGKKSLIDAYGGDINSSAGEVFKTQIMKGKPFAPTITRVLSSEKIIEAIKNNPNAIGFVGISWLRGQHDGIRVCRLGGGDYQPDSTVVPGQFFGPSQAHLLRSYYPITREVYMYTREPKRDVSYGFIAFVNDRNGQRNFVNNGLIPVTMPVRMVTTTSEKVQ